MSESTFLLVLNMVFIAIFFGLTLYLFRDLKKNLMGIMTLLEENLQQLKRLKTRIKELENKIGYETKREEKSSYEELLHLSRILQEFPSDTIAVFLSCESASLSGQILMTFDRKLRLETAKAIKNLEYLQPNERKSLHKQASLILNTPIEDSFHTLNEILEALPPKSRFEIEDDLNREGRE